MRETKRTVCWLMMLLFVVGSVSFPVMAGAKAVAQEKCPVMSGTIDKSNYVDYEGKRIYFCCNSCPEEFKKNPKKYMKKLQDEGEVLEDVPKNK